MLIHKFFIVNNQIYQVTQKHQVIYPTSPRNVSIISFSLVHLSLGLQLQNIIYFIFIHVVSCQHLDESIYQPLVHVKVPEVANLSWCLFSSKKFRALSSKNSLVPLQSESNSSDVARVEPGDGMLS